MQRLLRLGPVRALLPGFDSPPIKGKIYSAAEQLQYLPPDPDRQARILEKQQDVRRKKKQRMHPLLRGYSGTKTEGRKLGWPMVDAASPTEDQTSPIAMEGNIVLVFLFGSCEEYGIRFSQRTTESVPNDVSLDEEATNHDFDWTSP